MDDLKNLLETLDVSLKRARPDQADALQPPATKKWLAKLPKDVPELATWFGWHDGQKGTASLSPEDNRYLLSIEAALDAAKFLASEGSGWNKSWWPLFANGAGDYVVLETATGKDHGALFAYWHDDDGRGVEHPSLEAWAQATTRALDAMPPGKRAPREADPAAIQIRLQSEWAKIAVPDDAALVAAAVGTAYRVRHHTKLLAKNYGPLVHVYVKIAADSWVTTSAAADADPIAELLVRMHEPPQEFPRFQRVKDAVMGKRLAKSLTMWDGTKEFPHEEIFGAQAVVE